MMQHHCPGGGFRKDYRPSLEGLQNTIQRAATVHTFPHHHHNHCIPFPSLPGVYITSLQVSPCKMSLHSTPNDKIPVWSTLQHKIRNEFFTSESYFSILSFLHICNMNNSFSQRVLIQPHGHHANLKGPSLSDGNWHPSLHDSQESDSESLSQEIQYQLELQKRIYENEVLVGQSSDELENDSLDEDSLEEKSLNESEGANYDKVQFSNGKDYGKHNESKQQPTDRYCNLRYNPNWKSNNEGTTFSEVNRRHHVAEKIPQGSSQDSSYLSSKDVLEENNQLVERQNVSFAFDTELLSLDGHPVGISSVPFRLHTKGELSADDCQYKDNSSTHSDVLSPRSIEVQQQRAKKDFVEKNKLTLGLATQKQDSYLHLHSRKREEVHQGQVSDVKTADERLIQNAIDFQSMAMDPEDKWLQRSHHLKDHQNKRPQADRKKLNRVLRERSLPANDVQHPPGRLAEPRPQYHTHRNVSEFENFHMDSNSFEVLELEKDDSSSLHSWLQTNPFVDPITPFIKTSSAADWETHSNTLQNNSDLVNRNQKQVSMNLASSRHHLELKTHKNATGLNLSPAYINEENKKYQHNSRNRPPYNQQHLQNSYVLEPLPPDGHAKGHMLLHQKSIASTYNANFQESVKDQVSTQNHRKQFYIDKSRHNNCATNSLWPSQSSGQKPLAGPSPTTQLIQTMEQHHQKISHLEDTHLAERQFSGLFPPVIPRVESDSEINTERSEGSQVKISRSNSEGYLLQMEKQKQLKEKGTRKPSRPRNYMNLNVKLGGLGPDYEAVREKSRRQSY
ncbi:jhy protein homolog isoform X3 [Mauremys reevesii]|uniref:jhy protein homolog isoform X3 n=1 Tax=Mauremys reevesii TaxID=260615 RepID=UPI00193FA1E8|nr:jhy protein homolog isoform X3 [Mauremys reevesii]